MNKQAGESEMRLKVGGVYKARNGESKGPIHKTENKYWPFFFDGVWYKNDGVSCRGCTSEMYLCDDLIAEWQDTPTDAPEVGKWIGWNGGECPVHPETVVEVVGGWDQPWTTKAHHKHVEWDNVIAYRIVTPYVEPPKPREYTIDPTGLTIWFEPSDGLIHVREVLPDDE